MSGIAYGAAVVLSGVFGWAAVAKLRALDVTARGFAGLGLPAARLLALAVPSVELLLAVALVTVPVWGAVAALALLAAFTGVVLLNVNRPGAGCNCFGASPSEEPVSWAEVVRNLFLAAAAVMATGASRPLVPSLPEAVVVTSAALLGAVLLGVLRFRLQVGQVWANRLPGEPAAP